MRILHAMTRHRKPRRFNISKCVFHSGLLMATAGPPQRITKDSEELPFLSDNSNKIPESNRTAELNEVPDPQSSGTPETKSEDVRLKRE